MPTLEVTVIIKQDGLDVPGFPMTRRVFVDSTRGLDLAQASTGTYVAQTSFGTVAVMALGSLDESVTVRLAGQSDEGIPLNAGGFVLVVDGAMADGAATNVTVNNNSGGPTQLVGVFGGT